MAVSTIEVMARYDWTMLKPGDSFYIDDMLMESVRICAVFIGRRLGRKFKVGWSPDAKVQVRRVDSLPLEQASCAVQHTDVDAPVQRTGPSEYVGRPPKWPWKELKVGESFVMNGVSTIQSARTQVSMASARYKDEGFRFRCSVAGPDSVRVTRTEMDGTVKLVVRPTRPKRKEY